MMVIALQVVFFVLAAVIGGIIADTIRFNRIRQTPEWKEWKAEMDAEMQRQADWDARIGR